MKALALCRVDGDNDLAVKSANAAAELEELEHELLDHDK
jgi:hypothetical protein